MIVKGEVIKLRDNVDTDVILPGKYLTLTDYHELAEHALEGLIQNFKEIAGRGAIIVAGKNFGCGSSREHAPIALKYAGVRCVVAEGFARIFHRNAINIGLSVVESREVCSTVEGGDRLTIDLKKGVIRNLRSGVELAFNPLPGFMLEILGEGGLIPYLKKRVKQT